jgi:DNA polymerase-1
MVDKNDKRLFLLDAYALIYRAYFAFSRNPRINSKGMNTSAIFGFTTTLLNVLKDEDPTHIAVVFDPPGPTERVETFSDYKANREAMPEDIRNSIDHIKSIIRSFRIPALEVPGYEADDVIGTLAKKAEKHGYTTYMMTPDKDFGQLVSPNIFMYKPARMGNGVEIWGEKEVCERFQIKRVDQVIDFLGMMGDAVDNIPGIPGVGEKTAQKFLAAYDSMEGLYENTDQLKGKLKEKVENGKEQAFMSKMLATIITDAPIDFDEEDLIREEPDAESLKSIFEELEFRRLSERIFRSAPGPKGKVDDSNANISERADVDAPQVQMDLFGGNEDAPTPHTFNTLENTEHNYVLTQSPEMRAALIAALRQQSQFCFDTETTGLDARNAELVGMSFSWKAHQAWYVPIPSDPKEAEDILADFKPLFEDPNINKIAQNIKYDIQVLANYGIVVQGALQDTMLVHYLLHPDMRHNMDFLAESYLHYRPVPIEQLIGKKGKNQKNMRDVDPAQVSDYAAEDADITFQLFNKLWPELREQDILKVYEEIEAPLIPVLAHMERTGIALDSDFLRNYSEELKIQARQIEEKIYALAGEHFNIHSPAQLGQILFGKLKLVEKPKKTKTGQFSTSEDILSKLAKDHDIVNQVLEYRSVTKLISTYVDALPELVDPKTGRIHTSYNQAVAATGRLSSNNPNLQNIPIRTERGRKVREAFVAKDDSSVLFAADYSQIELRLIAALSGDQGMIEAFKLGQDIHAATASKVYGVSLEEVDRDMRSKAKMVNFGIIYGISAFGLADRLNIARGEAREIIDSYFEKYPRIKEYMDESIAFARDHGYVKTLFGRKRHLKDINSRNATVRGFAERNAINAPIQGSAADIIKLAMIDIHQKLKDSSLQGKMLLQVHDELVFEAPKSELSELESLVVSSMEGAAELAVPLVVESGVGSNWLEAH